MAQTILKATFFMLIAGAFGGYSCSYSEPRIRSVPVQSSSYGDFPLKPAEIKPDQTGISFQCAEWKSWFSISGAVGNFIAASRNRPNECI